MGLGLTAEWIWSISLDATHREAKPGCGILVDNSFLIRCSTYVPNRAEWVSPNDDDPLFAQFWSKNSGDDIIATGA